MKKLAVIIALLSLLFTSIPVYAGQQQLVSTTVDSFQRGNPQPAAWGAGVTNPTPCVWNFDDQDNGMLWGYLVSGQTVTFGRCLIADNLGPWAIRPRFHFLVGSPSNRPLDVRVCFDPGVCVPIAGVKDGNTLRYEACTTGPRYVTTYPMPEIPGSNGGHGIRHEYALTVTNINPQTVRDIVLHIEGGNDHNYCPQWPLTTAYFNGDFAIGDQQP